jgi:hypothetical protein
VARDVEVAGNFVDHYLTFNLAAFVCFETFHRLLEDVILILLFQLRGNLMGYQ